MREKHEVLPKTMKEYRDHSENVLNRICINFYVEAAHHFFSQLRKPSILCPIETAENEKTSIFQEKHNAASLSLYFIREKLKNLELCCLV